MSHDRISVQESTQRCEQDTPLVILDHHHLINLLHSFPKRYLLIGSGVRLQYAKPERAIKDTLNTLRADSKERTLIIFGGDTANSLKPDLGYLVQQVKEQADDVIKVLSVQSWPERCDFVDYVFRYPREFRDESRSRELWGGTLDGLPVAATRHYLSPDVQMLLNAVICIGGGVIAKQELSYALQQGQVEHHYIRAEVRHDRDLGIYGPTDEWYQRQGYLTKKH